MRKKKQRNSVQDLIGINKFSKYGVETKHGEIAVFAVMPTNISVLSQENIDTKIHHLKMVLSSQPNIEIACVDSCECFDDNKHYMRERYEKEKNEQVKGILQKDMDYLDMIQLEMATARQFMFIARFKNLNDEQKFNQVNKITKNIEEQGFDVHLLEKSEIKKILAVYFSASLTGENIPDYDGDDCIDTLLCEKHTKKSKDKLSEDEIEEIKMKSFFDMICPSVIKFYTDYYIVGDTYRCSWTIRDYAPTTEEQAIFSQLADRSNVNIHIYNRFVDAMEQKKILQNSTRKNKLLSGGNDVQDTIEAQGNLTDIINLMAELRKNKEPLLHCAVFIELKEKSLQDLKDLQSDIQMELSRAKLTVDKLTLRQKEGFLSSFAFGYNAFLEQYERVLPASSVANQYPFNYSGKIDTKGFYVGKDKFGSNILVDFDKRAEDKTNSNILILGNSGQGKSYLMKLLLTNIREFGKSVIILDAEQEYEDLTNSLGGCYIDFMSGKYIINPLEPKAWNDDNDNSKNDDIPAFRKTTRLSQHIAYLKDFFKSYKDFTDIQIDALEILLSRLYFQFNITDETDYSLLSKREYPIMVDLYELVENEYYNYDSSKKHLYTEETLQELCLSLNSMCVGSESKYFNGYTNIEDDNFLCFGIKGLMNTNKRLKDAMLFNILSYMNNELLTKGNTVAAIDELYLFLTNMTAIEYIRNASKRVRKKDSAMVLASQNLEDFLIEGIREYTKPLFSIPSHQFLFNAGNIDPKIYIDTMQLEQSEFDLIKYPERGTCLYRCGNERYLLQVIAPDFKQKMFGKAGGR